MPHLTSLLGFALVSLGMVLTPGPNMIYLISRSITQGHIAGLISLGGVALGFVFYMLCAAFGITALLFAARASTCSGSESSTAGNGASCMVCCTRGRVAATSSSRTSKISSS